MAAPQQQPTGGDSMEAKMMFCSECENLLYPLSDADRKLKWQCRACKRVEVHDDVPLVYTLSMKREVSGAASLKQIAKFCKDPTVSRTSDRACERCGAQDLAYFINPLERPVEDMTLFFACANCQYVWKSK